MRCFILLGQGGAITSYGMYSLAKQLNDAGVTTSIYTWDSLQTVVDTIQDFTYPVVLIGFSLGANSCTQIAEILQKRAFKLLVAYDASALQPAGIKPIGKNVEKTLCYRSTNGLFPWGHGQVVGHNVTTYETPDNHLAVCYDQRLHDITMQAVHSILSS